MPPRLALVPTLTLMVGLAVAADAPAPVVAEGERLVVEGKAESLVVPQDSGTVLFGASDVRELPFSVNIISSREFERRNAASLHDILELDPAIGQQGNSNGINAGEGAFLVRGYEASAMMIDGMPLNNYSNSNAELLESVEVLRGPAAFRYGFLSPGGVINQVYKRPTEEFTASLRTQYNHWGSLYGHVDTGGRLGANKEFGYRLNLVAADGGTFVDDVEVKREIIGLTTDYRITPDTVVTATFTRVNKRNTGGGGFAGSEWVDGADNPLTGLDATDNFEMPWVYNTEYRDDVSARIDSKLGDRITFSSSLHRSDGTFAFEGFSFRTSSQTALQMLKVSVRTGQPSGSATPANSKSVSIQPRSSITSPSDT